jgi:hypothetical protein
MDKNTITIASLASVIGLGIIRMLLKHPKFSLSIRSKVFNLSAKVGSLSPQDSTDDVIIREIVSERRQSRHIDTS